MCFLPSLILKLPPEIFKKSKRIFDRRNGCVELHDDGRWSWRYEHHIIAFLLRWGFRLHSRYLHWGESSDLSDISQGFEGEDIFRFRVDTTKAAPENICAFSFQVYPSSPRFSDSPIRPILALCSPILRFSPSPFLLFPPSSLPTF